MTFRVTRSEIQAGQHVKSKHSNSEISAAITTIAIVSIYMLVEFPAIVLWNTRLIYNYFAPNGILSVGLYNVNRFAQVWYHFFHIFTR